MQYSIVYFFAVLKGERIEGEQFEEIWMKPREMKKRCAFL
jgi:hypothetical protein